MVEKIVGFDVASSDDAFQRNTIGVRCRLQDGRAVFVTVPQADRKNYETVARPLAVAKFAAGEWYQIGCTGEVVKQEPVEVE